MWFYIDSCSPFRQRRVYNRSYRTTRTGRRTKLWRWSTTWCSTRPTATPSSIESIRESTVYFESFTFYIQIVPSVILRILKLITKFTIWHLVVILDRLKGDKDVSLSNWLALYTCVSCMINAFWPLLFLFCLNDKITSVQVIIMSLFIKKKYVQTHWSADVLSFCR